MIARRFVLTGKEDGAQFFSFPRHYNCFYQRFNCRPFITLLVRMRIVDRLSRALIIFNNLLLISSAATESESRIARNNPDQVRLQPVFFTLIGREVHGVAPPALFHAIKNQLEHPEPPTTHRPNGSLLAPRWFLMA